MRKFPQQWIIGETKYTVIEDSKEGYSFLRKFFENFPQDEVESKPGSTSLLYIHVKGNSASLTHCLIQLSKIFCKFCVSLNDISIIGTSQWWGYPELHKSHYFNSRFSILPSKIRFFKYSAFFSKMPFHTMLDIIFTTALVPY